MTGVQQAVTDYVKEKNTTQEALATKLGFKRSAFFGKLRGASDFTLSEAYRLSHELGFTLDDFYAMTTAEA